MSLAGLGLRCSPGPSSRWPARPQNTWTPLGREARFKAGATRAPAGGRMQSAAAWVAAGKAKVAAPPATAVRPAVEGAGQAAALGWAVARSPAGNPLLVVG